MQGLIKNLEKAIIIITIIIVLTSISIARSFTYVENNIYVDNAGDLISVSIINVTSPPEAIVIPAYQPSAYMAYYLNNFQTMPMDFNGTDLIVLANETGLLNITYLSLASTSKQGIIWTLNISENYYTKVFLPQNSIPININPTPISVYYSSNSPVILMPPGRILIQYSISTQQLVPHKSNNYTYTIALIISIIIVILIILILIKRKNDKKEKIQGPELDERDKQILNAIKKLGGIATANQIISETNIPKTPLYRRLSKLVEMGYIEEVVHGKTKSYKLKDQ
ncbi:MAG: winged helix-turn-helix transcriptional regulator [Caldisphaera sp.]